MMAMTHSGLTVIDPDNPRTITFPYSRHSSYSELCELVAAFRPQDIHPCTVDEDSWTELFSMRTLFGQHCSDNVFAHDRFMMANLSNKLHNHSSQGSMQTRSEVGNAQEPMDDDSQWTTSELSDPEGGEHVKGEVFYSAHSGPHESFAHQSEVASFTAVEGVEVTTSMDLPESSPAQDPTRPVQSQEELSSSLEEHPSDRSIQRWAYDAAAGLNGMSWETFGGLECTKAVSAESALD